ncbi:MAG: bifunctional diaminohydroxyphosphoribosylaminopyrimidine deaminase/5-amino-6-(5-phosphoribosylamino)uracil reductase RibD [Muribaculaceae bacterium]|nr:bifunctional diaminohydroxyphosphoribosylaminopyrimidine deaminase/5-amino-6-(5-phosphoribosylamino)uracil reductase RibD [Muribaculaceae bacterium]
MKINDVFMKRALLLAAHGRGRVSPNPMVGAVIVHDGRIIGEGFHAFYGGPHAEVNAINSVAESDRHLLKDSTMYVTLEPCAHYGKTPPCAELLVKTGIPQVVIAASDPNPLVAGKGIEILKNAGVEVECGVLKEESEELNRRFIKAHSSSRPWIILKWAQSSDGFMAALDDNGNSCPVKFSSPMSSVWMHRERSSVDAIMVGSVTEKTDKPSLTVRFWGGNSPKRIYPDSQIPLPLMMENLRKDGITSLMVEGGPKLLSSFISNDLYDEIRVETSPVVLHEGLPAPVLPDGLILKNTTFCRDNIISVYRR